MSYLYCYFSLSYKCETGIYQFFDNRRVKKKGINKKVKNKISVLLRYVLCNCKSAVIICLKKICDKFVIYLPLMSHANNKIPRKICGCIQNV